jgi:Mycothiol maleylpyruvate isomerase N-terminal domain
MDEPTDTDALVAELRRERDGFFEVISAVSPESLTTPGLLGEWSAREIIAHLGYWAGHAVEAIHAVEQGRIEPDVPDTDAVNETVARVARSTDLATVRKREAASTEALIERLGALDSALLATELPEGDTLLEAVRGDGASHYREHAEELRRILAEPARG